MTKKNKPTLNPDEGYIPFFEEVLEDGTIVTQDDVVDSFDDEDFTEDSLYDDDMAEYDTLDNEDSDFDYAYDGNPYDDDVGLGDDGGFDEDGMGLYDGGEQN